MDKRYLPGPQAYKRMTGAELRDAFLVDRLFEPGELYTLYCDADRVIVGSAVPTVKELELSGSIPDMATEIFNERRETGIINIGQAGTVQVDDKSFDLGFKDALYIGRGAKKIVFSSADSSKAAKFYIQSYPAHQSYPTKLVPFSSGDSTVLGSEEDANLRTLTKLIHPGNFPTCQLVMGITELHPGNVWNTMPAHTHPRRTEVYLYFNMQPETRQFHLMGEPDETRHIIVADGQAVISPSWSIHSGAATKNYTFIWGMGGENQAFDDMDFINMKELG